MRSLLGAFLVLGSGLVLYYGHSTVGHEDQEVSEMASRLLIASWCFLPVAIGLLILCWWSFGQGHTFDNEVHSGP